MSSWDQGIKYMYIQIAHVYACLHSLDRSHSLMYGLSGKTRSEDPVECTVMQFFSLQEECKL